MAPFLEKGVALLFEKNRQKWLYCLRRDNRSVEESWERLKEAFHWLSETQLKAAPAYAAAYPDEIEERIRRDEQWTAEDVWRRYPFMSPKGR